MKFTISKPIAIPKSWACSNAKYGTNDKLYIAAFTKEKKGVNALGVGNSKVYDGYTIFQYDIATARWISVYQRKGLFLKADIVGISGLGDFIMNERLIQDRCVRNQATLIRGFRKASWIQGASLVNFANPSQYIPVYSGNSKYFVMEMSRNITTVFHVLNAQTMKKIACLDLYALEFVWIQDQCFVYCAAPVSGDAMLSYDINRYHVDVWSKKNGVIRGAGKTLQPIIKKPDDIANYYCMSHDAKWAAFYSHRKDNTKDVAFYDLTTGVLVKMVTISLEVDCINFMAWRPGDRAVVICFQNKDMPTSTLYHVSMAGEINKVCLPYLLHFYQPGSFSRTGNKLVILINDDVSGNYELPEKCRFLTISFVN